MSDTRLLLDGPELEPLLARAREVGGRVVKAERVRRRGIPGLVARTVYEVLVEAPGLTAHDAGSAPPPRPTAPASSGRPPGGATGGGLDALLAAAERGDAAAVATPAGSAGSPAGDSGTSPGAAALRKVGVPERLLRRRGELTAELLSVAAELPHPPSLVRRPGSVLAVVGEAEQVRATCAQMANALHGCPVHTVLVGDEETMPGNGQRLTSPRRAARLREQSTEGVVLAAVGTGRSRRQRRAAEAVLHGLRPDQVWAAVDARRPVEELEDEVLRAPAREHGPLVAAQYAGAARRPGALLGLTVGVGWIDGHPATPLAWAVLLQEAVRAAGAAPTGRAVRGR